VASRTERKPKKPRKPRLPSLPAEVPQFVIDRAEELVKEVRPLGHPRAARQDIVGALIDSATSEQVAAALTDYNPKLGAALAELGD
jgi:hypothetical protein